MSVSDGSESNSQPESAPDQGAASPTTPSAELDDLAGSDHVPGVDELIEKAGNAMARELAEWIADTEGRKLAMERLGEVISDWETEHGEITPEEIEAARAQLLK